MYEEFPFENYYAFICSDNNGSIAKRKIAREAHVARLNHLKEEGRLLLAGPLLNPEHLDIPTGGLIIAQFNTLEKATAWLNEEPYLKTNAYKKVNVHAFKNVFIRSPT
ncbi:YciI family protein [Legionella cincinnatiensis]|uniref:YciI-like protein n=1 Tax=Legionella cincinnatiensis TaxID=28085 RepID=A0A378IJI9_9GAMM|nr:YciI family protein [Legionella cincinnatiensis]KTC82097.1 YciI-like protein [Legionella cincinnatiensis]STX35428.1 YciI-like protein [Legionella cincinnatiensis]